MHLYFPFFMSLLLCCESLLLSCICEFTLGGDQVSMLTHTYPHKPLKKIYVTMCNHQADSPLYVWPDICSGDLQVQESMVIHDTECPL